jgi:hypothetical protein
MKAFCKTLFGDTRNLGVVAVLMVVETALVYSGHAHEAVFILPPLVLAGIGWLAPR